MQWIPVPKVKPHKQCIKAWGKNVLKKLLTLGIPYFTFSIATGLIKIMFSGAGNNEIDNIFVTLFLQPTAPYWYLYALFFVFLIIPAWIINRWFPWLLGRKRLKYKSLK